MSYELSQMTLSINDLGWPMVMAGTHSMDPSCLLTIL